jgi:alpha-beta hydrolase superfamily lysophospholipase
MISARAERPMTSAGAAGAFYLGSGEERFYALHEPAGTSEEGGGRSPTSVLLCPLFGNDDLCAYRARREWAMQLAAAGHATLRIDLPGTGDSAGGPYAPGRLAAWTDAVSTAAAWLSEQPGCSRVCVIGIGFGGLLCYRAACERAAIDDMVLWGVPARGRTFVRQLRALAQMEASTSTAADGEDLSLPQGAIASAGFVLSGETAAALEALDLTQLALPDAPRRRLLLLERDGIDVDARLRGAIEAAGAQLTVAPGPGYGEMVTPPQQSLPPREVFATVGAWLRQSPPGAAHAAGAAAGVTGVVTGVATEPIAAGPAAAPPGRPAAARGRPPALAAERSTATALELTVAGARVRETPYEMPHGDGRLIGVLAEGETRGPLCAVLLNAGALRRIGPNRMWVETARRWAARGTPTLRIDLEGIGDSDGDARALEEDAGLYVPRYVQQTLDLLDALEQRGLPPRFVLAGLCSGAYWALHAGLQDERVRGAFMVNPRALFWDPSIGGVRDARNVRKALRPRTWLKLARGQITAQRAYTILYGAGVALRSAPERAIARWRSRRPETDRLSLALDRLQQRGTRLLGVFTAAEPVLEELERDGGLARMRERANVTVRSIPGPLTSHTLEPLALQAAVSTMLDEALAQTVAEATGQGVDEGAEEPLESSRLDAAPPG